MPVTELSDFQTARVRVRFGELYSPAWMREHAHLSNEEIAAMLGCIPATVYTARRRMTSAETPPPGSARRKIRERLSTPNEGE